MHRLEYDKYLANFNARNYSAVKEFFADDVVIKFAGYEIVGKDGFSDFYNFFHHYVNEQILINQFAGDDENVIIDVVVRLEGLKELTEATLREKGFERLGALGPGEIKEIPQFIHYRIEDGKFKEIRCVIKDV